MTTNARVPWAAPLFAIAVASAAPVAAQPASAFPEGLQAHGAGGAITIACGAKYRGTSATLPAASIRGFSGCASACGDMACTASGKPSMPLPASPFQVSSGTNDVAVPAGATMTLAAGDYRSVNVGPGATLNMPSRTPVRIRTLSLGRNSTVNWQAGDHWIQTLTQFGPQGTFNAVSKGTTRIFVRDPVTLTDPVAWNVQSQPARMLLRFDGPFQLRAAGPSTIHAVIYSADAISLSQADVTGAVAGSTVAIDARTTITHDPAAVESLDFGAFLKGP